MLKVCMFNTRACSPGLPANSNRHWVTILKLPPAVVGAIESDEKCGIEVETWWMGESIILILECKEVVRKVDQNEHLVVAPLDVKYHSYDRLDS
jgi:hypothetical protein